MTVQNATLPRRNIILLWCNTAVLFCDNSGSLKTILVTSRKTIYLFYLNSDFDDFGLSRKIVLRAFQHNQVQGLRSTSASGVTSVSLTLALKIC